MEDSLVLNMSVMQCPKWKRSKKHCSNLDFRVVASQRKLTNFQVVPKFDGRVNIHTIRYSFICFGNSLSNVKLQRKCPYFEKILFLDLHFVFSTDFPEEASS